MANSCLDAKNQINMVAMDARVNKLSSCKFPDQYLKNKKVIQL